MLSDDEAADTPKGAATVATGDTPPHDDSGADDWNQETSSEGRRRTQEKGMPRKQRPFSGSRVSKDSDTESLASTHSDSWGSRPGETPGFLDSEQIAPSTTPSISEVSEPETAIASLEEITAFLATKGPAFRSTEEYAQWFLPIAQGTLGKEVNTDAVMELIKQGLRDTGTSESIVAGLGNAYAQCETDAEKVTLCKTLHESIREKLDQMRAAETATKTSSSATSPVADDSPESDEAEPPVADVTEPRKNGRPLQNAIDDEIVEQKLLSLYEEGETSEKMKDFRRLLGKDLSQQINHRKWIENMSGALGIPVPVGLESMSPEQQKAYAMLLMQSIDKARSIQREPIAPTSSDTESIDTASTQVPVQPLPVGKPLDATAKPFSLTDIPERLMRWVRGRKAESLSDHTESVSKDLIDRVSKIPRNAFKASSETFSDDSMSESDGLGFSAVGPQPQSTQDSMADRLKNLGGSFEDLGTSGAEIPTQDSSDGPSEALTPQKLADKKPKSPIQKPRSSQAVQGATPIETQEQWVEVVMKVSAHLDKQDYQPTMAEEDAWKISFANKSPPPHGTLEMLRNDQNKLQMVSTLDPRDHSVLLDAFYETGQRDCLLKRSGSAENTAEMLKTFASKNYPGMTMKLAPPVLAELEKSGQYTELVARYKASLPQATSTPSRPKP